MTSFHILALSLLAVAPLSAVPLKDLPNIQSFTIWEFTSPNNNSYTLAAAGPEVNGQGIPDFTTSIGEAYDFFYSDANGAFNANGEYLTFTCSHNSSAPSCNISHVGIDFSSGPASYFNTIVGFTPGNMYVAGSELGVVDGDLESSSVLGNTFGGNGNVSMTLGLAAAPSKDVPEPATYATIGCALIALAYRRRCR